MRNDTIPLMHPGQLFYHLRARALGRLEFKTPPPIRPFIHFPTRLRAHITAHGRKCIRPCYFLFGHRRRPTTNSYE